MKLSMEDVSDKVEVYLDNKPLQKKLADRSLILADSDGSYRLVSAKDIKFRINNWPSVRADRLMAAAVTGVFVGASVALFIIGIIRIRRNQKKENGEIIEPN